METVAKIHTNKGKVIELTAEDFPLKLENKTLEMGWRKYVIKRTEPLKKCVMNAE